MSATAILTKHKTFSDVVDDAHDGIDTYLMSSVRGDKLFLGSQIQGVGATSYPIYRLSFVKQPGIFGFLKPKVLAEECVDVLFSFKDLVKTFEEIRAM